MISKFREISLRMLYPIIRKEGLTIFFWRLEEEKRVTTKMITIRQNNSLTKY